MKTGQCPRCRCRMVLVKTARCDCGLGHRWILRSNNCPQPVYSYVVRTHGCGRRVQPHDVRELEAKTA